MWRVCDSGVYLSWGYLAKAALVVSLYLDACSRQGRSRVPMGHHVSWQDLSQTLTCRVVLHYLIKGLPKIYICSECVRTSMAEFHGFGMFLSEVNIMGGYYAARPCCCDFLWR